MQHVLSAPPEIKKTSVNIKKRKTRNPIRSIARLPFDMGWEDKAHLGIFKLPLQISLDNNNIALRSRESIVRTQQEIAEIISRTGKIAELSSDGSRYGIENQSSASPHATMDEDSGEGEYIMYTFSIYALTAKV